jgi:hypothetical protein
MSQPDPSVNHNHCCSSRKLLSPTLLASPVSPSLPAATQSPFSAARGVTAICVNAIMPLAVVGLVLDVCSLWIRAQVTLRLSSSAAQVLSSACRPSSLIVLSESRIVNLQGRVACTLTRSAVTSSCRTCCLCTGDWLCVNILPLLDLSKLHSYLHLAHISPNVHLQPLEKHTRLVPVSDPITLALSTAHDLQPAYTQPLAYPNHPFI